jgi:uncharacterized protein (TIGR03032 family)
MAGELPPFSCSYTPGLAALLHQQRASLAITTYQAGKLIFISAKNERELMLFPRTFHKPMGIALHENRLAVASKDQVTTFVNVPGNARRYPKRPDTYDAIFLPRSVYFTGELDLHDLEFTSRGLIAVNTRFSCISLIDDSQSFVEVWRPPFIKELVPGDCCHLNGMVIHNEELLYATALGETNEPRAWRSNKAKGGVLIDTKTNHLVLRNLPMPHSPRLYKEGLFMLLSATGELVRVDVASGKYDVIHRFNGFVRGLDRIDDVLFIGLSKLRSTSKEFGDLPIAQHSPQCGLVAFNLKTGKILGELKYETSVEEIFDVRVLRGVSRPGILSIEKKEHEGVIVANEGVYWPMPNPPEEG